MSATANVAARLKTEYLRQVLNQESKWFDMDTSGGMGMSARMTREVEQIKSGIGQKVGLILYSFFMSFSGLLTGFYKGWSLALAMFAIAPILCCGMGIFGHIMQKNSVVTGRAYSQAAGYAEQALAAVRIVVSFGAEKLEMTNYTTFLARVKEAGKQ